MFTPHLYTPDITRLRSLLDELVSGKLNSVSAFPLVVGNPFFYRKQVPLVVSKWGGFGFAKYGVPTDDGSRAQQIKLYKQELRNAL